MQGVSSAQQAYAKANGVPQDHVRVISPFVGGAFGSAGHTWPHQLLAAFAARQMRRPVKLVLTRKQMYSGIGYRPTSRQRMAIGADQSGTIGAMIHEGRTETAKYDLYEDGLTANPRFLYRVPNMRSTYRVVPLDVNLPTYMRGPGAVTGTFALESGMDDLAHRLGLDPIELRLRNEPDRDQTDGMPFSTRRLADCLKQGANTFGWDRRNPTPRVTRDGGQLIGIGMAAAAYHTTRSQCAVLGTSERRRHGRRAKRDQRHGPGHVHLDDTSRRRRVGIADQQGPIRPGGQQFSGGAGAFRVAYHGQCRLRRVHRREHVARPVHPNRRGGSRLAAERFAT